MMLGEVKLTTVLCLQLPLRESIYSLGTKNGYVKFINFAHI